MPAILETGQFAPRRGQLQRPRRERKLDQRIDIAEVKLAIQIGEAERLVQPLQKHLLHLGHPIAVRIPQQDHPVRTDPGRRGPLHGHEHRIVKGIADAARQKHCLGGQHVAIGQHFQTARMIKA